MLLLMGTQQIQSMNEPLKIVSNTVKYILKKLVPNTIIPKMKSKYVRMMTIFLY